MRKGYLLAAAVFAVVFCLVLVGCPKKPVTTPGPGMMPGGPGMMGHPPGMNTEAPPAENAAASENSENAEVAEPAADNAAADTSIPAPDKKAAGKKKGG